MSGPEIKAALSDDPEDELLRVELEEERKKKRSGWKRWAMIGVSFAVIALTFVFVLPRIADYGAVWDIVKDLSWQWVAALAGAALINALTNGPPWMAALPGLSFLQSTRVTLASTATTMVVPGGAAPGMAASFAMLRTWGFDGRPVGLAVAVTGIWNQLMILGVPIVAVAALVAEGGRNRTVELVALIALGVFIAIVAGLAIGLSSARLARKVGDLAARIVTRLKMLIRKAPVKWNGEGFVRFRGEAIGLIRRRWWFLTLATLANHLSVFLVLLVSLRAVGVSSAHITVVEAFAAWALSRVLSSIAFTPGGIGFVELGLTGVLVAFGASNAEAVAATLVYRVASILPTLVLGLVAALTFKMGRPTVPQPSEP